MTHPLGTSEWWRALAARGAPVCTPVTPSHVQVTFFWRGPAPDTDGEAPFQVLIDVNSVTDHHSETPQALAHIAGTDIWTWSTQLPEKWCGSYSFIPLPKTTSFQYYLQNASHPAGSSRMQAQRAWWVSIQDRALADPINPLRAYRSGWGGWCSPLILPDTPRQASWAILDESVQKNNAACPQVDAPVNLFWQDHKAERRRARFWQSAATDQVKSETLLPLIVILDGTTWTERFPLRDALMHETRQGVLPPAGYLFITHGAGDARVDDLGCNPAFWHAVKETLLPQLDSLAKLSRKPQQRVLVGQSLGGLSALYAALCVDWGDTPRFGSVLSQSGSFWWPDSQLLQDNAERPAPGGWLCQQPRPVNADNHISLFIEVGAGEGAMIDVNQAMANAMRHAGHHVMQRTFSGGHDALCWRHGILDGLRDLLRP